MVLIIRQNVDMIRNFTGLREVDIETRIRDLDIEKQSQLILAFRNNNPNNLSDDVLKAYNSIRACQDYKILIDKKDFIP